MTNVENKAVRTFAVRRVDQSRDRSNDVAQTKRVLNTGSGVMAARRLHAVFANGWTEVRLDIDARVKPDLVGTITDMRSIVPDASFDAIWASHNLEHLHGHEVQLALREFRRVLKDDGFAFVTSPDLEAVAEMLVAKGAKVQAYMSPAGPITPLDMLYGHGGSIAAGNRFMCHNTGFTDELLGQAALDAGFQEAHVARGGSFDLWGMFFMPKTDPKAVAALLQPTPEHYLLGADG